MHRTIDLAKHLHWQIHLLELIWTSVKHGKNIISLNRIFKSRISDCGGCFDSLSTSSVMCGLDDYILPLPFLVWRLVKLHAHLTFFFLADPLSLVLHEHCRAATEYNEAAKSSRISRQTRHCACAYMRTFLQRIEVFFLCYPSTPLVFSTRFELI